MSTPARNEQDRELEAPGEEFIDENDVLAEVGEDVGGDHPMDEEDDIAETGGDEIHPDEDEIVWEDNSIQQFTSHNQKSVFAVSTHPTQSLAVSGGEDDMGYIWDLHTGEIVARLSGHEDSVAAVGFSADGEMVATGGMDGHVRLWKRVARSNGWKNWEFLTDVQGPDEVVWLKWHPTGNVLAAGSTDSTVWIWNFPSGTPMLILSAHDSPLTSGLWTPNGKRLLTASQSGTLILTDPRTQTPDFKLSPNDARFAFEGGITSIGVNPAGTLAVVGGADGQVRVVHLGKGEVVGALESHAEDQSVESIAFYGDFVLTGGTDGKIHISDLTTLRLRSSLLGHEDAITSLIVHGDGLVTSASADKTLRTWDIRRGEELMVHKGHAGPVLAASVGKRGEEEVVIGAGDEGVCLVFATR
ncbi:putative WD repeat-containing protein C25H1,08c [Schizosaccharomyces pombe 972h-] [Rhizoctonia solani]|uniref:Putative WD repeat-containing protein C25H1,08c [Schizosaccharomyces pombe 972h-] n=1 Tax=Rhizoctonia solani TaxID=456999 RepID=A0A0K6G119_9AGAM|nr:putative WD repeat-containing protein C25H1,08c [Schizosaccharomyces pombe 972h-] [Rhizoctonia solani]